MEKKAKKEEKRLRKLDKSIAPAEPADGSRTDGPAE